MYENEFANRIDIVIDKIGGVGKASSIIGVSNPTIGRWKDGTSDAKLSNIAAFAQAAGVSLDWLVFGDSCERNTNEPSIKTTTDENIKDEEYAYIPAYDIEASAGHGSCVGDNEVATKHLAFRKQWIAKRGLNAKDLVGIFTKGDSMEPTIADGGAIIIDKSRNHVLDGKIYVLRIHDDLYVKRVQRTPVGLRLISDNRIYDPLDIDPSSYGQDQFVICGQVIHASYDLPD